MMKKKIIRAIFLITIIVVSQSIQAEIVYMDFEGTTDLTSLGWEIFPAGGNYWSDVYIINYSSVDPDRGNIAGCNDWGKANNSDYMYYDFTVDHEQDIYLSYSRYVLAPDTTYSGNNPFDVKIELRDQQNNLISSLETWHLGTGLLPWEDVSFNISEITQIENLRLQIGIYYGNGGWYHTAVPGIPHPGSGTGTIGFVFIDDLSIVPEPATILLLGFGAVILRKKH